MAFIKTKRSLWDKHCRCPVYIDYNYRPKKPSVSDRLFFLEYGRWMTPPALMCSRHNAWIKWLSHQEAQAMTDVGAEVRNARGGHHDIS